MLIMVDSAFIYREIYCEETLLSVYKNCYHQLLASFILYMYNIFHQI